LAYVLSFFNVPFGGKFYSLILNGPPGLPLNDVTDGRLAHAEAVGDCFLPLAFHEPRANVPHLLDRELCLRRKTLADQDRPMRREVRPTGVGPRSILLGFRPVVKIGPSAIIWLNRPATVLIHHDPPRPFRHTLAAQKLITERSAPSLSFARLTALMARDRSYTASRFLSLAFSVISYPSKNKLVPETAEQIITKIAII
jgi:hypothetical protein